MVKAEGRPNPVPPLSIPTSPSPSPEASPASTIGGMPIEEPKLAKVRLKAAAEDALRRAAPTVTVTGRFPVQHMQDGSAFGYNIGQLITVNGRSGAVVITIELPQGRGQYTCATEVAPDRLAQCRDLTGPNGEHIISLPSTGDGSTNGKRNRTHIVRVVRTDGSIVTVECGNATKMAVPMGTPRDEVTDFGITTTSYTGRQPPLTIEQVTALALDQALTLYP